MSQSTAVATGCLAIAMACVIGALRCLADRLLASAAIYTLMALCLAGGAAKAVLDAV
jgi:hypothetical protein